jgi:protein-S-isoprenylcysteine O-methyltransferase Ste14
VPFLTSVLPFVVFVWIFVGAVVVFTRGAGERSGRGFGIAISIWATLWAKAMARPAPLPMQVAGLAGLAAALGLYHWAGLSIRGRVFSYAGNTDLPTFVHRSGPYAYVRNPFYLSYLIAEISTIVMWPSRWGFVIVVLAIAYFQWLVRYEEGKFERSGVAADYAAYKAATGRFLPRLVHR